MHFKDPIFVSCLGFLLWITLGISANAHPNQQNAMWVQFEPGLVHVAVDVSLKELSAAAGIEAVEGAAPEDAQFFQAAEAHCDYVLRHLTISIGTAVLSGRVLKLSPPAKMGDPEKTFFQYELEYPFDLPPPREVRFEQDMLKERPYARGVPWDISYIVRTKCAGSDRVSSWLLSFQKPTDFLTGWGSVDLPREVAPENSPLKRLWIAILRLWEP